jgi:beta-lactamase class A
MKHSARLQSLADDAVRVALESFAAKKLEASQLALSLVDLQDPANPEAAGYRGGEQVYPASVIKLFYLVAAHAWMESGQLRDTPELRRALRDMIVDSLNEATGLVVDSLTDTTSGPELPIDELEKWYDKRNAVNRYFASLGYGNINVNRKTWCEGPYGRDMQSVERYRPNHRNWLTTDATARLLVEIVTGRAVSAQRSAEMMELLRRDPFAPGDKEDQAHGYTGRVLPPGSRLWSKAGWMSEVRHDAAYVELPNGAKLVLVIFTAGHSKEHDIIPAVAKVVIDYFAKSGNP